MKFANLTVTANSVENAFLPYDRGAKGAYVWRKVGTSVYAPRVIASAMTSDTASDKYQVQHNTPRVCEPVGDCLTVSSLGTDIVKSDFRFLATTTSAQRLASINLHIALLEEFKAMITDREVIYS